MLYLFVMAILYCLLSACGFEKFVDKCINEPPSASSRPARDGEGQEVKMWVPKDGMIPHATWETLARGAEKLCSNGDYIGKNITHALLPSERTVCKTLPKYGNKIWAYYCYYGEDIPGFNKTDWYETVFNIYADANGRIYGCAYAKYPRGWHYKNGTTDGIIVQ